MGRPAEQRRRGATSPLSNRADTRIQRFRVSGLGFRVQGLGSRVSGVGFRAQGLGLRASRA